MSDPATFRDRTQTNLLKNLKRKMETLVFYPPLKKSKLFSILFLSTAVHHNRGGRSAVHTYWPTNKKIIANFAVMLKKQTIKDGQQ